MSVVARSSAKAVVSESGMVMPSGSAFSVLWSVVRLAGSIHSNSTMEITLLAVVWSRQKRQSTIIHLSKLFCHDLRYAESYPRDHLECAWDQIKRTFGVPEANLGRCGVVDSCFDLVEDV